MTDTIDTLHSLTLTDEWLYRCRHCGKEFESVMRAAAVPCEGKKEKA